ncbi:MAG: homocysteine S-methyltransferase family protein [Candidatus Methylomirabilales bacterium]
MTHRGDQARTVSMLDRLRTSALIAEGAMATELYRRGLRPQSLAVAWNLVFPERVWAIHAAYVSVGVEVLKSNTFGANRLQLEGYGAGKWVKDVNRAGVEIARRALPPRGYLAGAVGPAGTFPFPRHRSHRRTLAIVYAEQCSALLESGVDLLLLETQVQLREALLAARLARRLSSVPLAVSCVFQARGGELLTADGFSPGRAAQALADSGADIVGCNCLPFPEAIRALRQMRRAVQIPCLAMPSAGYPKRGRRGYRYPLTVSKAARGYTALAAAGTRLIGGCCGMAPRHLATLSTILQGTDRS